MLCMYKTCTQGSPHLPARWVAVSAGLTLMVQANIRPKMSWLGGVTEGCGFWRGEAVAGTLTCPGSTHPLHCPCLGCSWVMPISRHGFLSSMGASQLAKPAGTGCPGGTGAASPCSTGHMPAGFLPKNLSCCEDKSETIWKSKSIPAQCRASLIASLSAFNCNELYGLARWGAEPLG